MNPPRTLSGSLVAIVTPMLPDGALDWAGLEKLIDWHVAEGTDGIVIVGTTGESATVDVEEHCKLIESAVRFAKGRVPVIAGAGGNSTREAIELTRFAKQAGASHALSVVPYYNKPTQEGLYRHFKAIAEAVDIPVILYNVPGRTVADISNETVLRLAGIPNVIGIKEATASIERVSDLMKRMRKGFLVFSGDDMSALAYMLLGAHGVISVTANVAPRLMHELCEAARKGDIAGAVAINNRLLALHKNLFLESNPIPVKWALGRMGRIAAGIRLPLTPLAPAFHEPLAASLREAGCIE
ncbi:MAG TPA: 4-hydroxy-tetrahydrodipicolinate synthase [Usitatibacter sp.]|nr:4-hydroxy-tetrahydrodipicolinate synthase [Usitatibacter sp.]